MTSAAILPVADAADPSSPGIGRTLRFVVPGTPKAWKRARGWNHHTADEMRKHRDEVRERATNAGALPPMDGAVAINIVATFDTGRERLHGTPHTNVPDADNLAKALLDALSTCAFRDDRKVARLSIVKIWGREARTEITVQEITETPGR